MMRPCAPRCRVALACAALGAALLAPPFSVSRAERFDPQKYFEERAREALVKQAVPPQPHPQALPPSGGGAAGGVSSIGIWLVAGICVAVAALGVVLWLKVPSLTLEPRTDEQIDREFRAMLEETGEELEALEGDRAPARRLELREEEFIEDLSGEGESGAPGGGKAT